VSLSSEHSPITANSLYFRQLLSGRDFAINDSIARQMVNFAYLIGDRSTGECVIVDPAYAASDLVAIAMADGMSVTGALASHYHADHIGGSMMGYRLKGIDELLAHADVPIHINRHEREWVIKTTGVDESSLVIHEDRDVVKVGSIDVTLLHTPGHTPGSQCFLVQDRLVSGDTLFLDGCGRTDLPGSHAPSMFHSLRKLAALPPNTTIFPGHFYSTQESETLQSVMGHNFVFGPQSESDWTHLFG
jgi:glyoxylase-like metal-dependent hydrolase (beta-lactamase superfamily II)